MTSYVQIYNALKPYGVKGTQLDKIIQATGLPELEIIEILRKGMNTGAFESWYTQDDQRIWRLRPDRLSITQRKFKHKR